MRLLVALYLTVALTSASHAEPLRCVDVTREAFGDAPRWIAGHGGLDITAGLARCDDTACELHVYVLGGDYYSVPNVLDYRQVKICASESSQNFVDQDGRPECSGKLNTVDVGIGFTLAFLNRDLQEDGMTQTAS